MIGLDPGTAMLIVVGLFALDVALLLWVLGDPRPDERRADGGVPPVDCTVCTWQGHVDDLKRVDKSLELALCPDCLTTKLEYTEPTNGGDPVGDH